MIRRVFLSILIVYGFILGVLPSFAESEDGHDDHQEQEHDDHGHGHDAEKAEGNVFEGLAPKKKRLAAVSYGDYMNNFRKWCDKIDHDGRMLVLFSLVNPQANVTRPDCKACKPLFRSLAQACKPPPAPKEKKKKKDEQAAQEHSDEVEAPPTPTIAPHAIKQREPHIQVLDLTSRLFVALSEDEELSEPTIPALQVLLVILRDSQNRTPAEAEYLSILAEYIEAPFKALIKKKAQEAQEQLEAQQDGGVENSNPRGGLDDLF